MKPLFCHLKHAVQTGVTLEFARSEPVIRQMDPRGRPIYWVGPAGSEQDAGPGTDFHAVRNGYVSVTPIHVDLTRYDFLETVKGSLGEGPQELL